MVMMPGQLYGAGHLELALGPSGISFSFKTPTVIYHVGWTVKRVREDISRARSGVKFQAAASVNDPSLACSKADLLYLIGCLGRDVMQDNGTYLF